jgi:hypothetical protein
MTHPVPCPRCRTPVGVGPADLGRLLVCPDCGTQFVVAADQPAVGPAPSGPAPVAVGLALCSWGIPIAWLVAPFVTGRGPVFSFAAPVAVAVGLTGLGVGAAFARWAPATRVKVVVLLLLAGYVGGGFLFAFKREWAEAVRDQFRRGPHEWADFREPAGGYTVRLPGRAVEGESPLAGWELKAFRVADRADLFVVAAGPAPGDLPAADEAWFEKAKQAIVADAGDLRGDPRPVETKGKTPYPGREFVLDLPGQTVRVVRVFRVRDRAYYLAAQGPFWHPATRDVKQFFDSFRVGKQ